MNFRARTGVHWRAVWLLGIGHGLGDFNAGVLLALLGKSTGSDLVVTYLLYNVLAFVGQPFAGLICDRVGKPLTWFFLGGILSAASLTVANSRPETAVICSGLASAFYHSAGGAAAWALGGRRAIAAGIFAAPGVVGLAIGLSIGGSLGPVSCLWGGLGLLLILALLHFVTPTTFEGEARAQTRNLFSRGLIGGVLGWLVVIAIAARSFAWSMGQEAIFPPEYAVWLALAAAVGKYAAGFLADKMGAGVVTVIALFGAAALLALGGTAPLFFFPAVTTLQAGTAPMMALVFRAWPRHPAFGSGLAQGFAVAVGGAPLLVLSRMGFIPILSAVVALVVAGSLVLFLSRRASKGRSASGLEPAARLDLT